MEADSQQEPGYSIPIRAPLTLDSDSESCLSVNNYIYSRTSSFNSTSSSIDVSSYSYEHSNILEQESSDLVAYPDEEIVIKRSHVQECSFNRAFVTYPDANCVKESSDLVAYPDEEIVFERCFVEDSLVFRPFVRYPDGYFVKESCGFSDNNNFRPFVKVSCEESCSDGFGVPIAPLTGDGDSDGDSDGGGRWDGSGWIRDDGFVQEVAMVPKVRSFNGDEVRVEGVFSGDNISGIENFDSVSTESVENEVCEIECLNEVVKVYGSEASSFDLERVDALTVSSSNNEIDTKLLELDEPNYTLERIDAQIVSNAESEVENLSYVSTESVETEVCEVKCMNEVVKLSVSDASSFDLEGLDALTVSSTNNETEIETKLSKADELSFDSARIIARIVSDSASEIENFDSVSTESVENEGCKVESLEEAVKGLNEADVLSLLERTDKQIEPISDKLSELDEPSFDSERVDAQIASNPDNEIENLNSISTESIASEGCKVERLTEVVKLSESDVSSLDLERLEAQTSSSSNNETEIETINVKHSERICNVPNSDSEIEIKTINECEQVVNKSEEPLKKMQRIRTKFLRLALNEQLTMTKKVNGEGGNYNFDFSLTILAIGKTGVGKSATINSIFGENKAITNAFNPGTTRIQEVTGNVDGVQLRVIDTPGLKSSYLDRPYNLRILNSIKRFTRKHTPNVVLYVDRLDTLDVNDAELLKLITSSLGSSVWHSCIIALTHAGYDPSDEPSKGLVVQRCRFLQEQIVSFGGNNRNMANPVWLVDNHPSYKHDVMDLHCDLKGLVCLDQVDEDDGCKKAQPSEALSEARNVINSSRERRDAHSKENGYCVKLVVNDHWFGLTWS